MSSVLRGLAVCAGVIFLLLAVDQFAHRQYGNMVFDAVLAAGLLWVGRRQVRNAKDEWEVATQRKRRR